MGVIRIVSMIVWALFAVGLVLMAIVDFTWFYVFMAVGCTGVSVLTFLEYRWNRSPLEWYDED